MIITKPGVKIGGMRPELVYGIMIVASVYGYHGYDCVVTCVTDGYHVKGSRHYVGLAAGTRTRDLREGLAIEIAGQVQENLGADWDVTLEPTHLHFEYDPEE